MAQKTHVLTSYAVRLRVAQLCLCLLAAIGCACSSSPPTRPLTILHLNDLHSRFLPLADGRGGFAHVASAIEQERAKSPNSTLVLHGGDFVQGSPVSSIFEGMPVFELANEMGFDAHTLGNHEFDYGWQKIPEFIAASRFATVSANVVNEKGELLTPDAYVIRDVAGMRVGIIGMMTARLDELTRAPLREPWKALPVVETARRYALEIKDQVDFLIVLSHMFNEEEDDMLAHAPEVPLIIGGHFHGGQDEVKEVEGRICVKTRAYGVELGRLDLQIDIENGTIASHQWERIQILPGVFPAHERVQQLVDKWEARVSEVVDVPIGESTQQLGRHELRPWLERLMADAVGADFAYMNRGGIRDGLPKGPLTARNIWNILPFGNTIAYGELAAAQIPPEAVGRRQIDPRRKYVVATNSFIAEKWREEYGVHLKETGPVLRDVVINWVREQKVVP